VPPLGRLVLPTEDQPEHLRDTDRAVAGVPLDLTVGAGLTAGTPTGSGVSRSTDVHGVAAHVGGCRARGGNSNAECSQSNDTYSCRCDSLHDSIHDELPPRVSNEPFAYTKNYEMSQELSS
jgi:hypothetical protein